MNRSALKTYAPKARREFIQAVTDRAAFYGLTKDEAQPVTVKGDVAIIGGKAFPRSVAEKRAKLEDRIERLGPGGFERTMEAVAYTWFNRLVAIRYMELHGYLDHGYRVLSHPEGKATPEIVEHAEHVELPGLNSQRAIELKLDGTKESELFRMLLIAQCNALHSAMPFLFERIDDETELLLPDNLLHSDSIVRKLVSEIEEADWQQVEIIGWLYQFYISDKKDEVIGKVVKSEDIPAATQLFTPNWIVKYLVQNSLGRQWLATYPDSTLKTKWEYYIEPAEQTPEVHAKLKEITPTTLNPEELTIMDPACGSGHILVEAYDLLKDIYLERGYRLRDIPRLILTTNVYGLEIDDRAAQLSCFALLMKAREDDRKIFDPPPQLNVLAIQETNGLPINTIVQAFTETRITKDDELPAGEFGFIVAERKPLFVEANTAVPRKVDEQSAADIQAVLSLFENAKTYGSLIAVPTGLADRLPSMGKAIAAAKTDANLAVRSAAKIAEDFVFTATLLSKRYSTVAANPPYMGRGNMPPGLRAYSARQYKDANVDLYAMFVERCIALTHPHGIASMITMHGWMFLSSYESFRAKLLNSVAIATMLHLGPRAFDMISGEVVQTTAFTMQPDGSSTYSGTFVRMVDGESEGDKRALFQSRHSRYRASSESFSNIPGSPVAYWVPRSVASSFRRMTPASKMFFSDGVTKTGNNARFLRFHWEPSWQRVTDPQAYRMCTKGGEARRWYGNHLWVVKWSDADRKHYRADDVARISPEYVWQLEGVSWSDVNSSNSAFRYFPSGFIAETKGPAIFPRNEADDVYGFLSLCNSTLGKFIIEMLNPTISTKIADLMRLPVPPEWPASLIDEAKRLVQLAKTIWDQSETSAGFAKSPWVEGEHRTCSQSIRNAIAARHRVLVEIRDRERVIDESVCVCLGVDIGECPTRGETQHGEAEPREQQASRDAATDLLSYSVGAAMGRYSLDKPGLIYANSGNDGFDPSQYKTFPADPDGIIPVTEFEWFPDSASRRFEEFIGVAWSKEHLEENLQFIAESLTGKSGVDARETIRSYFANDFYKHHLQTYKKRPIYWLFSSGKQRAFQALVYLHRYHEGTLARMRTEYVIPLQGKIASRINQLEGDISKATSSAHAKKLTKEKDALEKQRVELLAFDEKLRHYADQRIKLDLDDGVKVNYGKFGDLLAEVKAICGDKEDEE